MTTRVSVLGDGRVRVLIMEEGHTEYNYKFTTFPRIINYDLTWAEIKRDNLDGVFLFFAILSLLACDVDNSDMPRFFPQRIEWE